ncbi:MAG: hypothetical protein FJ265_05060 [Planctomycetes bacterium]|nr:hypothetical protein [Planctomycetota bacterium]
MTRSIVRSLFVFAALVASPALAQDPAPAKGPDKEIAAKIKVLKDCVLDKKFARDEEGRQIVEFLLTKVQAGVDPKDLSAIAKALEDVLMAGSKIRPPENKVLYTAAATALGYCGPEGGKALRGAYVNKRFPEKKDWVPLREVFLRGVGRTKDETLVKFLLDEALRSPEAALQAAAGDALGNFEDAKEALRKEVVDGLIKKWGELEEKASQMGSANIEAQNAQDRLAAITDKWNTTLARLTRQNHHKFLDWQNWHNKNKNLPWQ